MRAMLEFGDKAVLVTGGSRGIGLAIAKAFAEAGATVHVNGTKAREGYGDTLDGLEYHRGDLSSEERRRELIDAIGPVDVLVNNYGAGADDEFTLEGFRKSLEINVISAMDLCLRCRDALAQRGGCIVNVGSVASHRAVREGPGYTAGKSAMWGMTRALADKWAPLGIRVNMVAPGFIETQMTSGMRVDKEREKRMMASVPMRRWGRPEELAGAALYLASPLASFTTGVSIAVDGGLMVR